MVLKSRKNGGYSYIQVLCDTDFRAIEVEKSGIGNFWNVNFAGILTLIRGCVKWHATIFNLR